MKDLSTVILFVCTILWIPGENVVTSFTFQNKQTNHRSKILASSLSLSLSTTQLNIGLTTATTTSTTSSQSIRSKPSEAAVIDYGNNISIGMYEHEGWNCSYLYTPASPGYEKEPPIVLIHPVGVGISSWFWTRVMEEYSRSSNNHPAIYAPDLIGCGLEHGASPWKPMEKGMFFPLSWVQGIETFLQTVVLPKRNMKKPSWSSFLNYSSGSSSRGCTIVVQGGLAPVGVQLAARNTKDVISNLVLTSPPIYKDMITKVPQNELEWNYNWLRNPIIGKFAFSILESQPIIQFFSDLFLFQNKCDDDWLAFVKNGCMDKQSRTPIEAFNAGLLQHRSYEEELTQLIEQPTIIVQGESDKRQEDRISYKQFMKQCELKTLTNACNVVPWENPEEIVQLLQSLQ